MPLHPITIAFPAGGVDRRHSFQEQPPYTTPDSLNIWPFDAATGKRRLGTRPGLATFSTAGAEPLHWCPAAYQKGTGSSAVNKSSVALAENDDARIYGHTSSSWNSIIHSTGSSTNYNRSVAIYLQTLFFANGATDTPFWYLPEDSGGDIADDSFSPGIFYLEDIAGGSGSAGGSDSPERCTLALAWGDRLLLSGDEQNSNVVYGCRIGNYLDWDNEAIDPASSFSTGSAFGLIHPPVTTLIDVTQHVCIIGGMDSMHTLRGNPSGGGTHQMISANVGPIRNNGWCKLNDGSILFMSRAGLFRTNGTNVKAVSREKIPGELMGLGENDNDRVSLAYDNRWNGVHIVGKSDPGTDAPFAFFLDMEKGGFWPMEFSSFTPTMAMSKPDQVSTDTSNVLLLNKSGASKTYDLSVKDSADCHMCYGPIPVNGQYGEGVLQEITAVLGEGSDEAHWCIYGGNSPQEAWTKVQTDLDDGGSDDTTNADFVGTDWEVDGEQTLQYVQRPMQRCNCFYLKVWGDTTGGDIDDHLAIEEIIGKVSVSPERRVR